MATEWPVFFSMNVGLEEGGGLAVSARSTQAVPVAEWAMAAARAVPTAC